MMIRRIAGGVSANIFDKLVISGTQLALVPVMANSWGLHLYGLWVLMFTAPNCLAMGDFGFATAAGSKMTMAVARGDQDEAVHIFQSAWIAILFSSMVLVGLLAALALLIPSSLFGTDPSMPISRIRLTLFLLVLYGVVAMQGSIFFAGLRCAGLFAIGAFWNALIILIESVAIITAILLGAQPLEAAATLLIGRIVGLIGQNVLLRRRVPWLKIGFARGTLNETKSLMAPAGAVMLVPIAQACSLQGIALALGLAAGQVAVPAFTAARTLSRVGLQMCWLLNTAIMPEFSAASARGDRRMLAVMVLATAGVSAALVIPYAIGFALFGRQVILLWTHGVIHSTEPLLIAMAGSVLFGGFWYPISNLILALNRHASYTLYYVIFAAISMPLSYLLSRQFDSTGAGLAMMALDFAMFAVIVVLTRRILVSWHELRCALPLVSRQFERMLGRRWTHPQ
jgi:O-antigen/teichoic acid export membrane protein